MLSVLIGGIFCFDEYKQREAVVKKRQAIKLFPYAVLVTLLSRIRQIYMAYYFIGLDKSGYQVYIFLISPRKHMLWVLIRSASARRF